MGTFKTETDIVSLSSFRSSYKEYITSFTESERDAIILTQNGKAAAVLLSPREYDRLKEHQAVTNLIACRLQEIANQDFVEDEDRMWKDLQT
jgi:prevent-host-death family protein